MTTIVNFKLSSTAGTGGQLRSTPSESGSDRSEVSGDGRPPACAIARQGSWALGWDAARICRDECGHRPCLCRCGRRPWLLGRMSAVAVGVAVYLPWCRGVGVDGARMSGRMRVFRSSAAGMLLAPCRQASYKGTQASCCQVKA